uniref:Sugar ABC transporter ATP-binding protein n=1 Tax=Fervidobacterium pennivorans TaxID=93466 RepID=A0A7V4NF55_FERPE
MEPFLRLENISKRFGGVVALDGVSLAISQGEILGLVGENGSGKSTLIKILSGVYTPDQGNIWIDDRCYKFLTPSQAIKEGISVIYQDFALCPNLTVAENIAIARLVFSNRKIVNWQDMYRIAAKSLFLLTDHIPLDVEVGTLSTADRQIVAIARALLENARLIVMDEPTTALTEKEITTLFSLLKKLRDQGITIIFVSHKLQEVKQLCDHIVVLRDGRKTFDGSALEVDVPTLQLYMTGRVIETLTTNQAEASTSQPSLLKVVDLSLPPYFYDISFELKRGEVIGITGLLGSGRRELALTLVGIMRPRSGAMYIEGTRKKIQNIWQAWQNGIAYVPEDRITEGLHLPCSITANVILPGVAGGFIRRKFFRYSQYKNIGEEWRSKLNIKAPTAETPVKNLSGGNQQRVVLAKCLATQPKIIVMNCPTMGIDVSSKAEIHRMIRSLSAQGLGIVLITDDIPELLQTCDKIIVLKKGRIAYETTPKLVTEEKLYEVLLQE